jgi:hypothetical protein
MEPGDITELAKTGRDGAGGFWIGHLTGNDLVIIGTLIYLAFQCVVLAPKVIATIRKFLKKEKDD